MDASRDNRDREIARLRESAKRATKTIGRLASNEDLQGDDEAVRLLRQAVEELAAIRERLKALEAEVAAEKTRGGAQDQQIAAAQKDMADIRRTRLSGYVQFQYFDTNREGSSAFDAFSIRRARLSLNHQADPRTSLRLSADFATGTERLDVQLKDAYGDFALAPSTRLRAGQFNLPLGYEIERSSAEREFPERTVYNRTLFAGERGRGVSLRHTLRPGLQAHVEGFNALTIDDPEQEGRAPGVGSRLAVVGGITATGRDYRVGLSGLAGERPSFSEDGATSPQVDRRFVYLDGEYTGFLDGRLILRGELMRGHDRVPSGTASAMREGTEMVGFHTQIGYAIDSLNQIHFRWEQFDPDLDTAGNAINGYGLAYLHQVSASARLTLAHEIFLDESRAQQRRYHQTTLRLQFRF